MPDADRIVEKYLGGAAAPRRSRGIRDNNPGNIRPGEHFKGEVGEEGGYCIFDTPENGIRAIAVDLLTKYRRGLTTIRSIIAVYAPPSENDTEAYIKAVCADTGCLDYAWIHLTEPAVLGSMVGAIIKHENGSDPYSGEQIAAGVSAALA